MDSIKILSASSINLIYKRLAHQIMEQYVDEMPAIVGMQTRGVYIGKRISEEIEQAFGKKPDFGILDVTFFRDDFRTKMKTPNIRLTEIMFDLYDRDIVLVDDVLYTGRTVRAAMDAMMGYGRPSSIRFCCLVDRGHRELPIAADYVGLLLPTHADEEVAVKVSEIDNEDGVYLVSNFQKDDDER